MKILKSPLVVLVLSGFVLFTAGCRSGEDGLPPTTATLSVAVAGEGNVTSNPAGINCGTGGSACQFTYPVGTSVNLTAIPASGRLFQGFSNACTTTNTSCTVVLNSNATVSALFTGTPPAQGTGEYFAVTDSNKLISFNRATPGTIQTSTAITGLQGSERVLGMDFSPLNGKLYAITNQNRVYSVDEQTAVASNAKVIATPLSGSNFGVDFDPVTGLMRVISDSGQNLRVKVDDGTTGQDGAISGATLSGAAYSFNFGSPPAGSAKLYAIDAASDLLDTVTINTNGTVTVTTVGRLNVAAGSSASNGFDIRGTNTEGLALIRKSGDSKHSLYSINLVTGNATLLGALGTSEQITGFAVPPGVAPPAPGNAFTVSANDELVSFNIPELPSVRRTVKITGLQSGETVLGIDIRPKDRLLYALGSTGRIYTLDPESGSATQKSQLPANTLDAAATAFGVNFNPAADRLRVVNDKNQNLRINVDDGTVIADAALTRTGDPGVALAVTGAAYTNSFNSAQFTTLYDIDTNTGKLYVQNPPNAGTLVEVGSLGLSVSPSTGFDIDGVTGTAYAVLTINGQSRLYNINLAQGNAANPVSINATAPLKGLALPVPKTPEVFGVKVPSSGLPVLVKFSPLSPASVTDIGQINGLQTGETIVGVDFRPADGQLYALGSTTRVYKLNTATGAATQVSIPTTTLSGARFGVDFNPVADRLRVVSDTNQNLRIKVDDGTTTADTKLARAPVKATGIAYTNSVQGQTSSQLIALDSAGSRIYNVNASTGALTLRAKLSGVTLADTNGFEIAGTGSNLVALAAVPLTTAVSALYEIDLNTGAATNKGTIGVGELVTGIGVLPTATPTAANDIYGITASNRLIGFTRNDPGTLFLNRVITGLPANEVLLGVDVRPSNSVLYALGKTSGTSTAARLYTINLSTGAATQVGTLAANPVPPDPYAGLNGTSFGMDFDPTVDTLRIVSDTGQNLSVNPSTALVTTGAALAESTPVITAAAYSSNFNGAAATTLYVLNTPSASTNATLFTQNPPNDGTLNEIGSLGVAAGASVTFDILGGQDGLVLAALQKGSNGYSTLYNVNLTTGAATLIGDIGPTPDPNNPSAPETRITVSSMAARFPP